LSTDAPTLGAVIVSYNTRDLLAACLRSLLAEMLRGEIQGEVWVVDNASTDGSAELVEVEYPQVRLIAQDHNAGFTAANNLLLRRWAEEPTWRPEWILLLNPDTELQRGSLVTLMGALEASPAAGVAGPRLVYPDGRFQHSAFRFPGLAQTWLDLCPVPRLYDSVLNGRYSADRYEAGRPFEVDFPLGACMLVRGEALARVGPLDEDFFMYCEEIDWCRRLRSRGYTALCVPEAVVTHHAGASTGQAPDAMSIQLWRSRLLLFEKHEPPWRRALLRHVVRLGLAWRWASDLWAAARGRIPAAERDARFAIYRAIMRSRQT